LGYYKKDSFATSKKAALKLLSNVKVLEEFNRLFEKVSSHCKKGDNKSEFLDM